jgi:hypothetical protein
VRLGSVLLAAAAAAGATAADSAPVALRRLFPREAEVRLEKSGLSRLALPPEVLAACRPDLSDLRLFGAPGVEIPFLVDAGTAPEGGGEVVQRFQPRVLEATRHEAARAHAPPLRSESFDLEWPTQVPRTGHWTLIADVRAAAFVARVRVDGLDGSGGATPLMDRGSIFRLGGAGPAEKLRLPLPAFQGRRLRVLLEGEQSFWLEPAFRMESAASLEPGAPIAVPLEILSSQSADGKTLVELARPRGLVPDRLRLGTTTGTFDRRVEVWDEGAARTTGSLGAERLFRVEALEPIGVQEMPLRPPRGDRLRVTIEDGDSPALQGLGFEGLVRQPSLVFSVTVASPAPAAVVLRFGGGRAHPPRYDVTGLLPSPPTVAEGARAQAAARLYEPGAVAEAHLGPVHDNPEYDRTPALAFAMHPAAAVDRRIYSHVRPVTVAAAAEGLSRLRLQPEDLAVLRDDLSDLRVADASGRQWPYLLDRDAATALVTWTVAPTTPRRGTSRYDLRPPVAALRSDRLLLDVDGGYFDRPFRIESAVAEGEPALLAAGRLSRAIGDPRPVGLDLPSRRTASLALFVEDGDDATLAIRRATTRVPLPEIYLAAPAGRYDVLLGAPDQEAPRYDLERVRDVVLAVNAAPIAAGALSENPDFSLKARLEGGGMRQRALMWGVLVIAVVVLGALTLRLAHRESSGGA